MRARKTRKYQAATRKGATQKNPKPRKARTSYSSAKEPMFIMSLKYFSEAAEEFEHFWMGLFMID